MQEVVDATLLNKVETSIERNKSLQMLYIKISRHDGVLDAILKGACGNTFLKSLIIQLCDRHYKEHLKAAVAELRRIRPQLELYV